MLDNADMTQGEEGRSALFWDQWKLVGLAKQQEVVGNDEAQWAAWDAVSQVSLKISRDPTIEPEFRENSARLAVDAAYKAGDPISANILRDALRL
jgi:hypothetical protein